MKKALFLLLIVLMSEGLHSGKAFAQDDIYVSYQDFYDDLSPYGVWVNDPVYGYVWAPDVDDDFRPYFTSGHWAMTEFGNTWVSDYPWGWACFHYGRWVYNDYYGWLWIPGNEWGPGWVVWRWGNSYCGWAPMYPGYAWSTGVMFGCPDDWWIFMHPRYLYHPRYNNRWRADFIHGPRRTRTIINNTTIVTHTYVHNSNTYYGGPRRADVEQVTRKPVQVYQLQHAPSRGNARVENNIINIYRPTRVTQTNRDGARPVPQRVIDAPRPVTKPEELRTNWNRPREFRTVIQEQHPERTRPFTRNAPPYEPQPGVRQKADAPKRNNTRQPAANPAPPTKRPEIRSNPNPPTRTPSAPRQATPEVKPAQRPAQPRR